MPGQPVACRTGCNWSLAVRSILSNGGNHNLCLVATYLQVQSSCGLFWVAQLDFQTLVAELGAANLDSLTHNPRDWANIIATSGTCPTSSHGPGGTFREMLEQCMRQGHDDVALSFQ